MVIHLLQDCVSNRAGRAGLCTCLDRYLYNIMSALEFDSNVAQTKPTQHPCKLSKCIWWPSFTKTSRAGHETSSGKMIIRSYVLYILIYNVKVICACFYLLVEMVASWCLHTTNHHQLKVPSKTHFIQKKRHTSTRAWYTIWTRWETLALGRV